MQTETSLGWAVTWSDLVKLPTAELVEQIKNKANSASLELVLRLSLAPITR